MAQNTTIRLVAKTITQLTDANATNITFQAIDGPVMVKATTNSTAPTDMLGGVRYNTGQGEDNKALLELFPGIVGVRLWAYADNAANVLVSHA